MTHTQAAAIVTLLKAGLIAMTLAATAIAVPIDFVRIACLVGLALVAGFGLLLWTREPEGVPHARVPSADREDRTPLP